MKPLLTLLLMLVFCTGFSKNSVYEQLSTLNHCWTEQKDIPALPLSIGNTQTEQIRLHLELVEKTLRARSTANLSVTQKMNRQQSLDDLHEYMLAGNFPQNEDYSYRTPIFIDKHDNFCAVGYLVKASGHESVSRMISAKTNLAYVREMDYPGLNAWANAYGFTKDELAWIQPTYGPPPTHGAAPLGKGTNGEVFELYSDDIAERLYVGGAFNMADSSVMTNNIAYVTETGGVYTWHAMGAGVNGPVYAITKFDNKIFVAGAFSDAGGVPVTNVAYWDGTAWHAAGCTYGVVKDLMVFNNELYAAGDFDVCAAMMEVNFAKWDGGNFWQQQFGLYGHVNTMTTIDSFIVLGGDFELFGDQHNVIKWTDFGSFQPFANDIENEVMDLEIFHDTLYAVCNWTSSTDSTLVHKLSGNNWLAHDKTGLPYLETDTNFSCNVLCVQADTLMMGGNFNNSWFFVHDVANCVSLSSPFSLNWFMVDSAINTMAMFKGDLIAGGKFDFTYDFNTWQNVSLNSICKKVNAGTTSVPGIPDKRNDLKLYPNPATSEITVENSFGATEFVLSDMAGRLITKQDIKQKVQKVQLPRLSAGTYLAELKDNNGNKAVKKLIIE